MLGGYGIFGHLAPPSYPRDDSTLIYRTFTNLPIHTGYKITAKLHIIDCFFIRAEFSLYVDGLLKYSKPV